MKIFILHTEEEHYRYDEFIRGNPVGNHANEKQKLFHNKTRLTPVTLSTGSFISFQAVVL